MQFSAAAEASSASAPLLLPPEQTQFPPPVASGFPPRESTGRKSTASNGDEPGLPISPALSRSSDNPPMSRLSTGLTVVDDGVLPRGEAASLISPEGSPRDRPKTSRRDSQFALPHRMLHSARKFAGDVTRHSTPVALSLATEAFVQSAPPEHRSARSSSPLRGGSSPERRLRRLSTGQDSERPSKLHPLHQPDGVCPSKWCVTITDLQEFVDIVREEVHKGTFGNPEEHPELLDDEIGPSIHEVTKYIIKPANERAGGKSWALDKHPEGIACDVFTTHCWAEGIFEYTSKVQKAWPLDAEIRGLYACFLANPQSGGVDELLMNDISDSPFAKALQTAKHFLVIPNRRVSIYKRLWCVYEAHLAVERANKGELKITLPTTTTKMALFKRTAPGLVSFVLLFFGGFMIHSYLTKLIKGPLPWVLLALGPGAMLGTVLRGLAEKACPGRFAKYATLVTFWMEMGLIGFCMGNAYWQLQSAGFSTKASEGMLSNQNLFKEGEGWACVPLAISLVVFYVSRINEQIRRQIAKKEGVMLDFDSVRDAECTNPPDKEKIMDAIKGNEDTIDAVIGTFSRAGKYDRHLITNIDRGMSSRHAKEGSNPYRICIAVWAWEYWWVTDMAHYAHHYFCFFVPLGSSILIAAGWCLFRDDSIFFFDALYWGGLVFLVASKAYVETNVRPSSFLSVDTLWLQFSIIFMVLLVCAYHYSEMRRDLAGPGGRRYAAECKIPAEYFECDVDPESEEDDHEDELDCACFNNEGLTTEESQDSESSSTEDNADKLHHVPP